ncbi:hypothetical protein BBP40_000976 [Aspergillus hancockii]|nr:hypothetical protein BBP40_000976 [Aspergillus hancockii]
MSAPEDSSSLPQPRPQTPASSDIFSGFGKTPDTAATAASASAIAISGASPNISGGGSSSRNNTISLASLLDPSQLRGSNQGHGINVGADLSYLANSIKNNDCTTCLNDALKKVFVVMGKIKEDMDEKKSEEKEKGSQGCAKYQGGGVPSQTPLPSQLIKSSLVPKSSQEPRL